MEKLKVISLKDLPKLRDLYKASWPLHCATHSTIQVFVDRFEKHPKWMEKVKFLCFGESWIRVGAFVMIYENRVFFNTLESFPYDELKKLLLRVEMPDMAAFVNIRDSLRSLLFDVIRIHHLEVISDIGTKSYLWPKQLLDKVEPEIPSNIELKPIRHEDLEKINSLWSGKFKDSEKFLEELIKYNPSVGVYNKKGEILAWNMRLDSGSMGVGQVDSNHCGNAYGRVAIFGLAKKIAQDFNSDVHFEILHGNTLVQAIIEKAFYLHLIDTQSWILTKKKMKVKYAPMWGHL
ncbi:CLUMA_CG014315, isoform A [Clunio marinus]|uniref:CLUMA_CG014315, isoform A n=1 Tax=Clunio marinus TaxID=568069 RepID=A0A1J1IQT4_9DIPT|nr:CLUMA_CG014315, isoform A [Clunio marinus]